MPQNAPSLAVAALLIVLSSGCGSDQATTATAGNQGSTFPPASVPLVRLSTDIFANSSSQHATEVEPDSFSFGPRLVAAFQAGRIYSGGSSDIGFAVSVDAGVTWQSGFVPGLTIFQGGGANASVSDPAVAYDARQDVWIISSLTIAANGATQVVVSRSTDGGMSWGNPVGVSHTPDPDKDWITCDNTTTSAFYGQCYVEWDDASQGDRIWMSRSNDGGQTWQPGVNPAGAPGGIGGQPLVQPAGTVIVPFLGNLPQIQAFTSHDGGITWTAPVIVAPVLAHLVAGGLRTDPLPSAQVDAAGNIYVVWQDCSFRASCAANDLVMSTSADGASWTKPARIPIDAIGSTFDDFIPGLGVDSTTSGAMAHLALTYYFYPQANCTAATCALYAGLISSNDGGSSWSPATSLAGPISLAWLPATQSGVMVGDYISTSFVGGKAFGIFAVAKAKSGSTFDEAIYTTQSGFDAAAAASGGSSPVELPLRATPRASSALRHRLPLLVRR